MSITVRKNSKALNILFSLVTMLSLALAFNGCKGAQKKAGDGSSGTISESDINADLADSDSGKGMGLETVHYDYDSSTLGSEAKATLDKNAQVLKDKGSLKVQVEGHTDERGGIQYNIALGERRAKAAKSYLVDKGVSEERISTISYGKEKPLDSGHDESAWGKNRRSNFRITEK